MNILDIDLDFFQYGRIVFVPNDTKTRPTNDSVKPWSAERTVDFFEGRCHLSSQNRIRGYVVEQHHELFHLWKQMISNDLLIPPFTVYHIDAHADLGIGDASWAFILGDLIHKPVEQRREVPTCGSEKINCGNYLSFAIANRWIKKLNFIINPNWQDDIPGCYIKWENALPYGHHNLQIQLHKYSRQQIDDMGMTRSDPEPLGSEPSVPFEIIPYEQFCPPFGFDCVFLSKSPTYTNPRTDELLSVVLEYIKIQ